MRIFRFVNFTLMAVIILFLCSPITRADGYTYNGTKLNTEYVLTFIPDSEFGTTSISHFNEALYKWNQAAGITLMKREPTTRHSLTGFPTSDNTSQIFKEVREDSVAPGETKRYLSWSDLSIVKSADILINSAFSFTNGPNIKSDQYDTWTVFIHEAGHVAGLDHSSEEDEVMYVSGSGIFKRSLGYFDALGISNLY